MIFHFKVFIALKRIFSFSFLTACFNSLSVRSYEETPAGDPFIPASEGHMTGSVVLGQVSAIQQSMWISQGK